MLSTQAPKSYKSISQRDLNITDVKSQQATVQQLLPTQQLQPQQPQQTQQTQQLQPQQTQPTQQAIVQPIQPVPTQQSLQQTINVVNITKNDSNSLLVIHDKDAHKFIIKDNDNVLGHFTIGQIFKFINYDVEGYLLDVDLGVSVDLIKKYLLTVDNDNINIVSHLESPITGNIELLVKLYKDIQSYEDKLNIEYEHLCENTKKLVKLKNRNFVYNILTHIIRLFATYTSTNKKISEETKNMIMAYSIGAVYKVNNMIKEDLDSNLMQIMSLSGDFNNLKQVRENMTQQILRLNKSIDSQSEKIDLLILNLKSQTGGADTDASTTTMTTTSNPSNTNTTTSNVSNNTTERTNNITNNTTNNTTELNNNYSSNITTTPNSELFELETVSNPTLSDSTITILESGTETTQRKSSNKHSKKGSKKNKSNKNTKTITNSISSFLLS